MTNRPIAHCLGGGSGARLRRGDVGEDLLDQRQDVGIVDGIEVVAPFATNADQAGQAQLR